MTPSLARMIVNKQGELSRHLRWYSLARVWRYEKPQKDRLREHWQLNVDLLGIESIEAEIEILLLVIDLFKQFKVSTDNYQIQINHRQLMSDIIVDYLELDQDQVGSICQIIDRRAKVSSDQFKLKLKQEELDDDKIEELIEVLNVETVDQLPESLKQKQSTQQLIQIFSQLEQQPVNLKFNLSTVRGFDYYTGLIFEVFENNQIGRSLLGGGRYDRLIESFGGQSQPAVGLGFGDVGFSNFLDSCNLWPKMTSLAQIVVGLVDIDYCQALPFLNPIRQSGINYICRPDRSSS